MPVGRILEDPLAGLAVLRDDKQVIGAHRVLLLARVTGDTVMGPVHENKDLT